MAYNFEKEMRRALDIRETNQPFVYDADEDGNTRIEHEAVVKQRRMGATGMDLQPPIRTPMQQAEPRDMTAGEAAAEIGAATAGLATGAVAGAAGLIGDAAGLGYGAYKFAFPDADEGRLMSFANAVENVSNTVGSEAALNLINSVVPVESMPPEMREAYEQAQTAGTFVGLGKAGKAAVEGAKKALPFVTRLFGDQNIVLPKLGTDAFPTESVAGKKVVFVPADMLDFGRTYEGLSEAPIAGRELRGGSGYGTLASSRKQGLGFASLSPEIARRIAESGADYMMVSTMSSKAHRSNIDFANILHRQMNAYADEGFISPENKQIITQKLAQKFPGLDDVFSDDGLKWLEAQSFETRAAVADTLDSPGMRELGAPPVARLIKETSNPIEAGYDVGQGSVLIKLDKKPPEDIRQVKEGDPHPSYPIGIFGTPVAEIPLGSKVEDVFDEYLSGKIATGSTPASAYRALTMALPVAELTPERLAKIPTGETGFIKSGRQARLIQDVVQDNWRMTTNPVDKGNNPTGLGSAEIIKGVQENEMSASLSTYTQSELNKKAKTGELVFYGLGNQAGSGGTGGKVYFGLNKNTDYADMYGATSSELTPNEVSIVGVMNNETGTVGRGIGSSSILKAIQEGATALDAYAVPSAKHPKGFLPDYYGLFGFEEVDRIPYDEKYLRDPAFGGSEEKYKKITRQWKASGWDESLGNPDLVIMKWKGSEDARSTATNIFIREGSKGLREQDFQYIPARGGDLEPGSGTRIDPQQGDGGSGVGSGDRGGIRDGGRGMGSSLQRGVTELESLTPVQKRALGLEDE